MPTTAKICGVSTAATLDAALAGQASYVGLNFFPPSPRCVTNDQAAALAARASGRVRIVGVFVNPDEDVLTRAVRHGGLDAVQLHQISAERVAYLRGALRLETWAVVAVRTRADLEAARAYRGAADRILYDARTPDDAALPGGMGLRFDWSLLDGFDHPLPWALSGGLTAANVREAIGRTGARLVDASSGVEDAPGVKSPAKIAAFLASVAAV